MLAVHSDLAHIFLKSKMADGCHFEKQLNDHNSASNSSIGTTTHFDPFKHSNGQNVEFLKIQDGG